jgi:hypothetical protein
MQTFKRKRIARIAGQLTPLVAALLLSVAAAGVAAARPVGTGVHSHARVHRGVGAPLFNRSPSMPPPIFNPSTPYTAPATPEVPVSPASPGSVFGNGPGNR